MPYVTVFEAIDSDVDLSVLGIKQIVKAGDTHLIHGNVTEMLSVNSRRIGFNRLVQGQQLKITIRPATEEELSDEEPAEEPTEPPATPPVESTSSNPEEDEPPAGPPAGSVSSESEETAATEEDDADEEDAGEKVVIQNEVSLEQLTAIKGIGKSTAEKVVALEAITEETLKPVINDALIPEVLALYTVVEE